MLCCLRGANVSLWRVTWYLTYFLSRSGVDSSHARSFLPLGRLGCRPRLANVVDRAVPPHPPRDATLSISSAGGRMQREELRCGTIQVAISNSGNTPAGRVDNARHACRSGQVSQIMRHPLISLHDLEMVVASLSNLEHD